MKINYRVDYGGTLTLESCDTSEAVKSSCRVAVAYAPWGEKVFRLCVLRSSDKRSKAKWRKYVYTLREDRLSAYWLKKIWRGKGCGGTFCLCLDFQLIVDRRSSPFGDLFPPKISSFRALDLLLSAVRGYDNGGNFRSSWWMDLRGERGIACAHDLEKFLL